MPRIAVSGHRNLPADTQQLVADAIRAALSRYAGAQLTGLSCLADGADQIFTRTVLDHGGLTEAVVPAEEYRDGLPPDTHAEYDRLLAAATVVHRLPWTESTPNAHMAASEFMLTTADEMWAVWDEEPARGYGGTADVVGYARNLGVPIQVIWPARAHRD